MKTLLRWKTAINFTKTTIVSSQLLFTCITCLSAGEIPPAMKPNMTIVDLNIHEEQNITLVNGEKATLKLLDVKETRDLLCNGLREVKLLVKVNGEETTLYSSLYTVPKTVAGIQIDCPVTSGFTKNFINRWRINKDARFRLWPAGMPLTKEGSIMYPVRKRWLSGTIQAGNEIVHATGEDLSPRCYYHDGFDIGGVDGVDEIIAATDGLVVSVEKECLPEHINSPIDLGTKALYILDKRGWFYRYSHLDSIDTTITPGVQVKMGQKLGILGKKGSSGGWAHLHFNITTPLPSGEYGFTYDYPLLREAYIRDYQPKILAFARPHQVAKVNDKVELNGEKSWAKSEIVEYNWTFCDGSTAKGPRQTKSYSKPGMYSEILQIIDSQGNVDYDFAEVQVFSSNSKSNRFPGIHASFHPSLGAKVNDCITFKVRSFRIKYPTETWDFGDGSPKETTHQKNDKINDYNTITHKFEKQGIYIVTVTVTDELGQVGMRRLKVVIE